LKPFSIAKRFQTSKNALGVAWGFAPYPTRDYPSLDPDPLLKSGGNMICPLYLLKRYSCGKMEN
jgi:hypothetical protein